MSNELDRAILKGMMAVGGHPSNDEQRRTYAHALIAELLRGMSSQAWATRDGPEAKAWFDCLAEIKRRAGLEGEG